MPDRILGRLSRKARWWMATLFVLSTALTMILLVGIALDQRGEITDLREDAAAAEAAKRSAENTQAVVICLSGVYQVPDFLSALDGLDVVLQNQIDGAAAALALDPDGPLAESRRQTWRRATRARTGLMRMVSGEDGRGGIVRQRKTLKECRALAAELGVDFDPLAKQAQER